jgi:hypothetical protein
VQHLKRGADMCQSCPLHCLVHFHH